MVTLISLGPSDKADKKMKVVLKQESGRKKTIHFGARGMDDFTKTKDESQKSRYLQRHRGKENWNDPMSAGFWAKNILWNKPTIQESLFDTKSRFQL